MNHEDKMIREIVYGSINHRFLFEQWIEETPKGRHMFKLVSAKDSNCIGCCFGGTNDLSQHCCSHDPCPVELGKAGIVIDLGPVNEDGCLMDERTHSYPRIKKVEESMSQWKVWVEDTNAKANKRVLVAVFADTREKAIALWNKR